MSLQLTTISLTLRRLNFWVRERDNIREMLRSAYEMISPCETPFQEMITPRDDSDVFSWPTVTFQEKVK